jgi:hypothetical protein
LCAGLCAGGGGSGGRGADIERRAALAAEVLGAALVAEEIRSRD